MPKSFSAHQNSSPLSYKKLFVLSLPAIAAAGLEPAAELIDTAILGQFNTLWVASLAATNSFLGSFAWIFSFLSYGVTVGIAQNLGQKKTHEIGSQIKLALWIAIILGLFVALILGLGKEVLLSRILGAQDNLVQSASAYWDIRVYGYPFVLISLALVGVLRGLQKITFTMYLALIITGVNAVGSYLAVYVLGWGIKGAATATVMSFIIGDCIAITYILRSFKKWGLDFFKPIQAKHIKELGSDGINLFGRTACLLASLFIMLSCITRLGTLELAAHQIILQVWMFYSYVVDGFATTATTLGAQLIGQGKHLEHQLMSSRLMRLGALTGLVASTLYFVFQQSICQVFTYDPKVLDILSSLWWMVVIMQPFNGVLYVLDGVVFGMRNFSYSRKRMNEGFFLMFLPFVLWAYIYEKNMSLIWGAFCILAFYRLISNSWLVIRNKTSVNLLSST